jgi:hypothetical protein
MEEMSQELLVRCRQDPGLVGVLATDFLHVCGHVTLAYLWLKMARVAQQKQHMSSVSLTPRQVVFYRGKIELAQFYMECLLPHVHFLIGRLRQGPGILEKSCNSLI